MFKPSEIHSSIEGNRDNNVQQAHKVIFSIIVLTVVGCSMIEMNLVHIMRVTSYRFLSLLMMKTTTPQHSTDPMLPNHQTTPSVIVLIDKPL